MDMDGSSSPRQPSGQRSAEKADPAASSMPQRSLSPALSVSAPAASGPARTPHRRATRAEHERRLAELGELLSARAAPAVVVRFACQKWGLGERAACRYVAQARERLCTHADIDLYAEFGKALAGYELILRRQLAAGDLRGGRATLDRLIALLGLRAPPRDPLISTEALMREIARLKGQITAR